MRAVRDNFGSSDVYQSPPGVKIKAWPTIHFYRRLIFGPLIGLWRKARKNQCDDPAWIEGSLDVFAMLEEAGAKIHIEGLKNLAGAGPCVFVANHMSALETFLLPAMIRPHTPLTYVVKASLFALPVFGPILQTRNPVVVARKNPREDLAIILTEGSRRLQKGVSIVVFPQSTRSINFSPEHFNTIGIKLARKAQVPVIPVALKTDALGPGKRIRELSRLKPSFPIRFKFGAPMQINGAGRQEHAEICSFISQTVDAWQKQDGINA